MIAEYCVKEGLKKLATSEMHQDKYSATMGWKHPSNFGPRCQKHFTDKSALLLVTPPGPRSGSRPTLQFPRIAEVGQQLRPLGNLTPGGSRTERPQQGEVGRYGASTDRKPAEGTVQYRN